MVKEPMMEIERLKDQLKEADSNLDKAFSEVKKSIGDEKNNLFPIEKCKSDQENARKNWSQANAEVQRIRKQLREFGVRI
jgi:DNA repair exonuclease SbcCD ATPase subunit